MLLASTQPGSLVDETQGPVSWGVQLRPVRRGSDTTSTSAGGQCDVAEAPRLPVKLVASLCPLCMRSGRALLCNSGCRHSACESCWQDWAGSRLAACVSSKALRPDCFHFDCRNMISSDIWRRISTHSDLAKFARNTEPKFAKYACLEASRLLISVPPSGLVCPNCEEPCELLAANQGCDHAACETCWISWSTKQLEECISKQMQQPRCIGPCCERQLSTDLWTCMHPEPSAVYNYEQTMKDTIARLQSTAGLSLTWAAKETDAGPICMICTENRCALLVNPSCEHSACEDCWQKWAEMHLPQCRGARRAQVRCIGASCQEPMVGLSAGSLIGTWQMLGGFQTVTTYTIRESNSTLNLSWGRASEDLVSDGECYTAKFLHGQVRLRRVADGVETQFRGNGSQKFSDPKVACSSSSIWSHLCARSQAIGHFQNLLQRRRRLQENELIPASAHVECPRAECIGLGYAGSNTVMCFFCEHQWAVHGTEQIANMDYDEMVEKLQIKRCPECKVGILKNGGCDHMTCTCGHEFWWTTLKPYR